MKSQRHDEFNTKRNVADGNENNDDYEKYENCDRTCDNKMTEGRCSSTRN